MQDSLKDIARELASHEHSVIVATLINMIVFYVITVIVYLTARKSRVNNALAVQKSLWVAVIGLIALPAYALAEPVLPDTVRVAIWAALSMASWWVLYEVYRANWHDSLRAYIWHLACEVFGYCRRDTHR